MFIRLYIKQVLQKGPARKSKMSVVCLKKGKKLQNLQPAASAYIVSNCSKLQFNCRSGNSYGGILIKQLAAPATTASIQANFTKISMEFFLIILFFILSFISVQFQVAFLFIFFFCGAASYSIERIYLLLFLLLLLLS